MTDSSRHPAGAPRPPDSAKPSFAALRHGDFRVYLVASSAAMMADNIEHVISYWVMFEQFRSPALAGFAVLSHWLPFLFLSVYFGALADRFDSRRIIQIAMALFMGVSAAWAVLFYTERIEVWHAAVLLVIHGIAGVLWAPASQLLIHDIVGRDSLVSAVRLNATGRQFGVFLGPAVGGGLMLALGPAAGLIANVLIYMPLTWWLWRVPYGARRRGEGAPAAGGFADALKAMREASGNRVILSMILLAGISSLLVGNAFLAQMPEYAHDLGTEKADFSYTVLLAANAAGAFAGGMILEARGFLRATPVTAIVLCVIWCFVIAGFAAATNYHLAIVLMFVAGFLYLAYNSMAQALVQLEAPAHLRGRLIGLYQMSNNGLRAFSGISVGLLGSLIGIHWSLALSAVLLLAATAVLLAFSLRAA